jgi:hypothetical protein
MRLIFEKVDMGHRIKKVNGEAGKGQRETISDFLFREIPSPVNDDPRKHTKVKLVVVFVQFRVSSWIVVVEKSPTKVATLNTQPCLNLSRSFDQRVENAIGCISVPEFGSLQSRLVGGIVQCVIGGRNNPGRVGAGNCVCALVDRDWSLSVFAQSNTGNSQHGRFLLKPA